MQLLWVSQYIHEVIGHIFQLLCNTIHLATSPSTHCHMDIAAIHICSSMGNTDFMLPCHFLKSATTWVISLIAESN
jgi:hypothetical protein